MPHDHSFTPRVPPQDTQAEQSTLGAMILDRSQIPVVRGTLSGPADYYNVRHQLLYEAILALYDRGNPVDLITLQDELKRRRAPQNADQSALEFVGGLAYLTDLADRVPTTANAEQYAQIVERKATLRRYQDTLRGLLDQSYEADSVSGDADPEAAVTEVLTAGDKALATVIQSRARGADFRDLADLETWTKDFLDGPPPKTVPTGFDDLDDVFPFHAGEVYGIAAPSKTGKSTFIRRYAINAARRGLNVVWFSLEMGEAQTRQTLVATEAGVNLLKVRQRALTPLDRQAMLVAANRLAPLPIRIDYTPLERMNRIRAKVQRIATQQSVDLIIIDYLGATGDEPQRNERTDQLLKRLVYDAQAMARNVNAVAVLPIQSPIDILTRDNLFMTKRDVSESRGMVAAFDAILGLLRPETVNNTKAFLNYEGQRIKATDRRWKGVMCCFTIANRYGPENVVIPLYANMATGKLGNLKQPWPWEMGENGTSGVEAQGGETKSAKLTQRKWDMNLPPAHDPVPFE